MTNEFRPMSPSFVILTSNKIRGLFIIFYLSCTIDAKINVKLEIFKLNFHLQYQKEFRLSIDLLATKNRILIRLHQICIADDRESSP